MRFRYIDEKGREVDLQTVEALAARIHLGAVQDDSPLYDAVADKWAPAGEHELFKQLKSEAEAKEAGGGKPSPLLGAVSHEPSELRKSPGDPAVVPDGPPPLEPADAKADEGEGLLPAAEEEAELATHLSDAWEPLDDEADPAMDKGAEAPPFADVPEFQDADSLGGDGVSHAPDDQLDGLVLADDFVSHRPEEDGRGPGPEDGEEDEGLVEGLEAGRSEGEGRSLSGAAAMPGWAAAPPPRTDLSESGLGDESGEASASSDAEAAAEEEYLVRSASEARKSAARARAEERAGPGILSKRKRRRLAPQIPVRPLIIAAVVILTVSAVTIAILRNPDALPTFRNGVRTASDAASVEPARARPRAVDLSPGQAAALAVGIRSGTREALALLDSLELQGGVAGGPPRAWLQGIYLANASDYPSVPGHWDSYRTFASAANAVVLSRFREAALQSMRAEGLSEDEASDLMHDGAHWVAPVEWEISDLLGGLTDLAFAALELHEYLVSVEDRIRYDPFEDSSVPVDPVVEAIPLDEEVEEEMWGRIRRVADEVRETQEARDGLLQLGNQMADEVSASAS